MLEVPQRMRNACVVRLSRRTDFAFRLLILLGLDADRTLSISEASRRLGLSSNHLAKIVQDLSHVGAVETVRGRSGGVRLTEDGLAMHIGALVRRLEPLNLVECFDAATDTCRLSPGCSLRGMLERAKDAFLAELDDHTVADLCTRPTRLRRLLA